jgi:DNA sulfur modification protein DndD
MIFEEVVLHNFGAFRERQSVNLTPVPGKPIILFGALNGSGKTTFLEAMQLALYGKSAHPTSRGRLGYHDYLARSINRYATPSEGAGIEFAFRHRREGRDESIRIVRTWKSTGKGIKESFEILRNNETDLVSTERWAEFVEDFIPNQIADLFFFDGEKIEGLADPTQSASLLRVGLHSLLGLDLVDNVMRSLVVVERRKRVDQLALPDRSVIEQFDNEIQRLENDKADLAQKLGGLVNEIERSANSLSDLEKRLENAGGNLYAQRQDLVAQHAALKTDQAVLLGQLIEVAAGDAPLLLLSDLLTEIKHLSTQQHSSKFNPELNAYIEQRDETIVAKLNQIGIPSAKIGLITEYLRSTRRQDDEEKPDDQSAALPLGKIVSEETRAQVQTEINQKLAALEGISERLAITDRNLAAVPQEETVKQLLVELERARLERERLQARHEVLEEEYRRQELDLERKILARQRKIEALAEQTLAVSSTQRIIRHSVRARETLAKYRDEIAAKHMVHLEQLITTCFRQLHRKKSIQHTVRIDKETYELQLIENGGQRISPAELSAGERQLLAVSVLWALAQASGRKLPTVIDTPLGRLDSNHRRFLVENYFPYASHQVILLSTDEEIAGSYYQKIKPFVGHEYSIVFDEERRSSFITPGYFATEALAA